VRKVYVKKIMCVFGTRPEAIKMSPVISALQREKGIDLKVCVSAQHRHMLDQVLDIFGIKSDYDLNIMEEGQSLYHITSTCLMRLKKVLRKERPDMVLVHGDTTTTFASALACYYGRIPVGHVEAGLRSFDIFNPYPEEANRVFTDRICGLLFAPTATARENLLSEKIDPAKIFVTGNTVIDALFMAAGKKHTFTDKKLRDLLGGQVAGRVLLVTAHRRENFGKPIRNICSALKKVAQRHNDVRIFYPVHPNPAVRGVAREILSGEDRIHLLEPLNYMDFINLMKVSYIVVTDSGGLQEEAPALGKPVVVMRRVTERPEAIQGGTSVLAGVEEKGILSSINGLLDDSALYRKMSRAKNPYGDGRASERICAAIKYYFGLKRSRPPLFKS